MHLLFHVTEEGAENVPKQGGYLLVANHICLKDPFLLAQGLDRQVFFMAKKEFFSNPVLRFFLKKVGAFSVDRGAGDTEALSTAVRIIDSGNLVALFPEGTRNRTGKPMRPKSGAAWLARATGAEVIPCGLIYEKRGIRRGMTVRYGRPITREQLGFTRDSSTSLRSASKLIMEQINLLTGAYEQGEDSGS